MKAQRSKIWLAPLMLAGVLGGALAAPQAYAQEGRGDDATRTPIKHVILIIGENRTFDNVFGTFVPNNGQTVWNLLSEGIVNADGTPGPNFASAQQWQASDTTTYSIHPTKTSPFGVLPQPNTNYAHISAPFPSVAAAQSVEPALPNNAYNLLTIGGTGLPANSADSRFPSNLPNGPFDLTSSVSYDDYTGDIVHRFFQMWQEIDCDGTTATAQNPSGCKNDLFPWVGVTVGIGGNGNPPPSPFTDESTEEGANSMGFYNVAAGDVSYFAKLAHEYALADNYHQAILGGTGANHIAFGFGTTIFYANPGGTPGTPPSNQIENPNPMAGTNNWYTKDGYGGGSYVGCSDPTQPGVAPVMGYLTSLPYRPFNGGDCESNAYYLVNNYNPGYLGNGTPAPLGATDFTIPPSEEPNLGLLLTAHDISWRYYGEGWDGGKEDGEKYNGSGGYCNICDPFLYSTQIMTNPALRQNLQGIHQLYADIQNNALPAVSIVKPDGFLDGHPASSKLELLEGFSRKIIDMIQANPSLWRHTAIMITFDEGGGYYDSGYIQPIDFFGDGTRVPLLVVSPLSKGVGMVHTYYDHVSFDKFVERNWNIGQTISADSRDNLPNPIAAKNNPYVPENSPAIGNLTGMFSFGRN